MISWFWFFFLLFCFFQLSLYAIHILITKSTEARTQNKHKSVRQPNALVKRWFHADSSVTSHPSFRFVFCFFFFFFFLSPSYLFCAHSRKIRPQLTMTKNSSFPFFLSSFWEQLGHRRRRCQLNFETTKWDFAGEFYLRDKK